MSGPLQTMLSERERIDALLARFDDNCGGTSHETPSDALAALRVRLSTDGSSLPDALSEELGPGRVLRLPLRVRAQRARLEDVQRKLAADELSLRIESLDGYLHQTEEIWGGDELPENVRACGAELLLVIGEVQHVLQTADRSLHSFKARQSTASRVFVFPSLIGATLASGGVASDGRAECGTRGR